jgi:hypothetical protein
MIASASALVPSGTILVRRRMIWGPYKMARGVIRASPNLEKMGRTDAIGSVVRGSYGMVLVPFGYLQGPRAAALPLLLERHYLSSQKNQ